MALTQFVARQPTRRARLAAASTRLTLRPTSNAIPPSAAGIALSRQIVAGSMAVLGSMPSGTDVSVIDRCVTSEGRIRGEWVRAAGVHRADAAVLYIHGSGYALCSPKTHRGLTSRLSALTGLPVFSVDYRLAPRHRFPAAADDVERAYLWLRRQFPQVVVAGDSAGGHLAVDLCLTQLRAGRPVPTAQVLLSPLWDLSLGLAAHREQVRPDPMISAAAARRLVGLYTAGADPTHARIAHVLLAGEILPPTLIQAGGREMLAADAHELHRRLTATGTPCRLEVWPGQMHVFQAMPRLVPEARPALNRAAQFLREAVASAAQPIERRTA